MPKKLVWITNEDSDKDVVDYLDSYLTLQDAYYWMYKCLGICVDPIHPIPEEVAKVQEAVDKGWDEYNAWYTSLVTGEPKASDEYTVDQLFNMGMIGLYMEVEE